MLRNVRLRYRTLKSVGSEKHLDSNVWDALLFLKTQDYLPGIVHNALMDEVTYPRFVNVDDDLLLTYRVGQYVCSSFQYEFCTLYLNINIEQD